MQLPTTPHGKAIVSCALGDTLGFPFEFSHIVFNPETSSLTQTVHARWSDDTQQSLILLDEYLRYGTLDAHRFMKRLVEYRDHPFGQHFGLHRGTGRGFRHSVNCYSESGRFTPMSGRDGNGAAMRVPSVAFAMDASEESIEQINSITASTHDMPNSFHAAEAVVRTAWIIRDGIVGDEALTAVVDLLPKGACRNTLIRLISSSDWQSEIVRDNPNFHAGHGFSLRSPLSAIYIAVHSESLTSAISESLSIGGDTDTTASMAAALASGIHPLSDVSADLFQFQGYQQLLAWDNECGPDNIEFLMNLEVELAMQN